MGQHLRPRPQKETQGLHDLSEPGPHSPAARSAADEAEGAALEAGRKLFAAEWVFTRACHAMDQLPAIGPAEIAFAGRSNVGKSSLLNALTGRKSLARSSNTPGRTRALNMFARADGAPPVLVDMPGYGYAKAPKAEVEAWTRLVFDYLRGRPSLARVYLLIDARHGVKAIDGDAMDVLDEAAVSYQVVLTKVDKVAAKDVVTATAAAQKAIAKRPAAYPEVIITSSLKDEGLASLRAAVATLVHQ